MAEGEQREAGLKTGRSEERAHVLKCVGPLRNTDRGASAGSDGGESRAVMLAAVFGPPLRAEETPPRCRAAAWLRGGGRKK